MISVPGPPSGNRLRPWPGEPVEHLERAGDAHLAARRRAGIDLLARLDDERAREQPPFAPAAERLPDRRGPEQETAMHRRTVERGGMALRHEAVLSQQALHLPEAVGAAETEGRRVAPGPDAGAVRHHEHHLARRRQHPPDLLEERIGTFAGLEP